MNKERAYRELGEAVEAVQAEVLRRSYTGEECLFAFRAVSRELPGLVEFSSALQLLARSGVELAQLRVTRCQITNSDFPPKDSQRGR